MVGAFGFYPQVLPGRVMGYGVDSYRDIGFDPQYQYINDVPRWPELSERAVSRGEDDRACRTYAACGWRGIVGLTVKLVGKLDAGNPHVQFDERCALQAR
jgi:hypothetical protein